LFFLLLCVDFYVPYGVEMSLKTRYVHTNLIAKEWQSLAKFYEDVFGCVPVPPERHLKGRDLERGTALAHARLDGVHLRLPVTNGEGPTLEVFTYSDLQPRPATAVNRPGFGHIAFAVDDVAKAREAVLAAGGKPIGEIVTIQIASGGTVTWCYVTDPEGNLIELQSWA
jgi:predicted enzyme related to lactoylglutathione lyase